jgi:hypothetical protein
MKCLDDVRHLGNLGAYGGASQHVRGAPHEHAECNACRVTGCISQSALWRIWRRIAARTGGPASTRGVHVCRVTGCISQCALWAHMAAHRSAYGGPRINTRGACMPRNGVHQSMRTLGAYGGASQRVRGAPHQHAGCNVCRATGCISQCARWPHMAAHRSACGGPALTACDAHGTSGVR